VARTLSPETNSSVAAFTAGGPPVVLVGLQPGYLICNEMTTMLDVSSTAALVTVIRAYQADTDAGVWPSVMAPSCSTDGPAHIVNLI
jgi:hypothetical protein